MLYILSSDLLQIRKNTVFEIELRYKRADTNQIYVFPKRVSQNEEEEEDEEIFPEGVRSARGNIYYDLHLQNQVEDTAY